MATRTWYESPLLVGFERMQELAERAARGSDGYPPYNIEALGADRVRITLAVAGFAPEDLTATVEGAQLVIRGERRASDERRAFLHQGIAARRFKRAFVLADGFEVVGAELEHGLLHVTVRRRALEDQVKTIEIRKTAATSDRGLESAPPPNSGEDTNDG